MLLAKQFFYFHFDVEFILENIWMTVDPYMRGRMIDRRFGSNGDYAVTFGIATIFPEILR